MLRTTDGDFIHYGDLKYKLDGDCQRSLSYQIILIDDKKHESAQVKIFRIITGDTFSDTSFKSSKRLLLEFHFDLYSSLSIIPDYAYQKITHSNQGIIH